MDFDHEKEFDEEIVPILDELTKVLIKHGINGFCYFDIAQNGENNQCASQLWDINPETLSGTLDILDMLANEDEVYEAVASMLESAQIADDQPQTYLH